MIQDHTHFTIENSGLSCSNNVQNQLVVIKLSCPSNYDRDINIHDTLDIEIFDSRNNSVLFDIKGFRAYLFSQI
jgi:hypothetical protein